MRGTRRTIVAAAGGLVLVLGVGGVAAATSGHGSRTDDPRSGTSTTVTRAHDVDGHRQRGKGPGSRHLLGATSTTVPDDDTSTTVDDDTSTTIEHETSSTLGSTTPTSIEPGDDNGEHHDGRDEDADHEADEHDDGHHLGADDSGHHSSGPDSSGHHDGDGGSDSGRD
jgi:hypothetical protein